MRLETERLFLREMTREDCCKALGISSRTLYNRAKELNLMMAN